MALHSLIVADEQVLLNVCSFNDAFGSFVKGDAKAMAAASLPNISFKKPLHPSMGRLAHAVNVRTAMTLVNKVMYKDKNETQVLCLQGECDAPLQKADVTSLMTLYSNLRTVAMAASVAHYDIVEVIPKGVVTESHIGVLGFLVKNVRVFQDGVALENTQRFDAMAHLKFNMSWARKWLAAASAYATRARHRLVTLSCERIKVQAESLEGHYPRISPTILSDTVLVPDLCYSRILQNKNRSQIKPGHQKLGSCISKAKTASLQLFEKDIENLEEYKDDFGMAAGELTVLAG